MSHSPVGKPVAIVGNWQVLLAPVANWLGRRSNAMADDFVDRLARRAGIKKVVHCTYRIPAFQNGKPEYAAVNLPRPFKQQIPRARCLLATARWREAAGGHIADDVSALFAMVFALLFGRGNGSGRRPAARIVPILHAFLEESITRHTLQSLLIRPELAGRHFLLRIDCKTRPRQQKHNQSGSQKRATRHAESP